MEQDARLRPLALLISQRRIALGITQELMVARLKKTHASISDSSLSRWEHGESTPLEVYLPLIAKAYRIPIGTVRKAWLEQKKGSDS